MVSLVLSQRSPSPNPTLSVEDLHGKYNIHLKSKEQEEAGGIDLLVTYLPYKPKDRHEKLDRITHSCYPFAREAEADPCDLSSQAPGPRKWLSHTMWQLLRPQHPKLTSGLHRLTPPCIHTHPTQEHMLCIQTHTKEQSGSWSISQISEESQKPHQPEGASL